MVAKYYDHITFARLCELLDLSREEVQYLLALNPACHPLPGMLLKTTQAMQLTCDIMKGRHEPASSSPLMIQVPEVLHLC